MGGDYAKLAKLRRGLAALTDGTARRAILDACRPVLAAEIVVGFQASASPEGKAWQPLRTPRRGPSIGGPLLASGDLMARVSAVEITPDGFLVSTPLPYANRHLFGDKGSAGTRGRDAAGRFTRGRGKGIPARPYLPTDRLPPRWQRPLDERATVTVRALLAAT